MTKSALQEAVASILTAYLSTHDIPLDLVPDLITAVGQALILRVQPDPVLDPAPRPKRKYRRVSPVVEEQRIADTSQIEMFEAEDPEPTVVERPPEPERNQKRRSVVRRDMAAANAEVVEEGGVMITKLPAVKRVRRG